jgi:hypothetical protein
MGRNGSYTVMKPLKAGRPKFSMLFTSETPEISFMDSVSIFTVLKS